MNEHIHFDYNGYEWKIEIVQNIDFLKKIILEPFIVFADDGYGNYLFIKENDSKVYEFFHETSEIFNVDEPLKELIGTKKKLPSKDDYPEAIYKTGEKVLLGDKVKFKVWVEFWKGWQNGVVTYVPGISPKKNKYERNHLKWIEIKAKKVIIGVLILPETGLVEKKIFIGRGKMVTK